MSFFSCPHCHGEIKVSAGNKEGAPEKPQNGDRKFVKIPSSDVFRTLCFTLSKHPKARENEKFAKALEDFPRSLEKYKQFTEGQWKFFAVIHKEILGTWPKAEEISETAKDPRPLDFDSQDEQIPF